MELQRFSNASTFITWPQLDSAGNPLSGLTITGQWIAWADAALQGPVAGNGNPGFKGLSGTIQEIVQTGIYSVAMASTELPIASPYVLLKFTATGAATQYVLIRTASQYAIADQVWNRDMSLVPNAAARSPLDAMRLLRNKWANSAGTLTVYKEDDATTAWTAAVTTDVTAVAITTVDPA